MFARHFAHCWLSACVLPLAVGGRTREAAPAPASAAPAPAQAKGESGPTGQPTGLATLKIGDRAPDFALPGIDGRTWTLADFKRAKVLMVLFTSNHCPVSHAMEKRLMKMREDLRGQSFALVAINPNHPEGLSPDELGYGRFTDSFEDMKPYARANGWDFPYLYDGQTQRMARAYGCLATPHVFVFDQERRLRYAGRFDDSRFRDAKTVKSADARNAVEALLAGRNVTVERTRPMGCSTKWREKKTQVEAQLAAWAKLPVVLEALDAKGLAELKANKGKNYRLINLWTAWCGPCRREFPDLVALSRRFDGRNFQFISISLDEPEQREDVLAFLQKQGAGLSSRAKLLAKADGRATNHYLFTGDADDLAVKLDPKWQGGFPYTVLVAPGGEIIWRHDGAIDPKEAVAAIVEALKPYYTP